MLSGRVEAIGEEREMPLPYEVHVEGDYGRKVGRVSRHRNLSNAWYRAGKEARRCYGDGWTVWVVDTIMNTRAEWFDGRDDLDRCPVWERVPQ